jgi:hypothetical protein
MFCGTMDKRRKAIYAVLGKLDRRQLQRILETPPGRMVCDGFAYEAATDRY